MIAHEDNEAELRARFARIERVLFACLTLAMACPLFVVAKPPLAQLPLYETTFHLLRQGEQAGGAFSHEVLSSHGVLLFALGKFLSGFMAEGLVYRGLMALSVAGFAWAFRALCRALARGRTSAWLGAPIIYGSGYSLGDLTLLSALALGLFSLAGALSLAEKRSLAREAFVILGLFATALLHVAVAVPVSLVALLCMIVADRAQGARFRALLAPLAALCGAALFFAATDPRWVEPFLNDFNIVFPVALGEHLQRLGQGVFESFKDKGHEKIVIAWVSLACLLVALGATSAGVREGASGVRRMRAVMLAASGALAVLFLLMPQEFDQAFHWGAALTMLSALFALACLPLPSSHVRGVLFWFVMALAFMRAANQVEIAQAFELREVADFDAALRRVPDGQRLLQLGSFTESNYVHGAPFAHYGAFYLLRSPLSRVAPVISDLPGWPLVLLDDRDRPPVADIALSALGYVYPATLAWADYVLMNGAWSTRSITQTELIYYRGSWSLYRVLHNDKKDAESQ